MCFRKANNAFQEKTLISTGKHGGGSIVVWACFSGSGPGQLALIDGITNSEFCQQIPDACEKKLGYTVHFLFR